MSLLYPFHAEAEADRVLEAWDDICNELGVDHCFVFGTCLGMVREGGYIRSHNDMDVYVRAGDLERVSGKLVERGFTRGMKYNADSYLGMGQHFYMDGILLDVSFELPEDEGFLKAFDEVTYKGRKYMVPHPVEAYLKHKYGNWRVPW